MTQLFTIIDEKLKVFVLEKENEGREGGGGEEEGGGGRGRSQ